MGIEMEKQKKIEKEEGVQRCNSVRFDGVRLARWDMLCEIHHGHTTMPDFSHNAKVRGFQCRHQGGVQLEKETKESCRCGVVLGFRSERHYSRHNASKRTQVEPLDGKNFFQGCCWPIAGSPRNAKARREMNKSDATRRTLQSQKHAIHVLPILKKATRIHD